MASDSESTISTTLKENTMITIEEIISSLKTFESPDLFKLLKTVAAEAEKKSKIASRVGKAVPKTTAAQAQQKKTGSMPKGAIPPQLKKPRAWVEFTLKDALENGWESFTVVQKKKDKETNTVTEEQIEMPGSTLYNGAHIYKDSITEKAPEGRQIIHKEAMSLSKQRKESGHATYAAFDASYVDEPSDDDKSVASSTSLTEKKKIVVKKTAAEKEAEAAAKKEAKESEKAAAKAAKEAEKGAKKAEKEAEKEAAKAAKEAEKEAKKADKKPVVKAPVPAAAVTRPKGAVSTSPSEDVKKVAKPAEPAADASLKPVAVPQAPQKKKAAPKVEEVPNDGMVHPCTIKGKKYLRNADGETWTVGADGGVGEWAGMYDAKTDKLDTTAAEPVFEDSD